MNATCFEERRSLHDTSTSFPTCPPKNSNKEEPPSDALPTSDQSTYFNDCVRSYLQAPLRHKQSAREHVLDAFTAQTGEGHSLSLLERIKILLIAANSALQPGRLDDAIDVLADRNHVRLDLNTFQSVLTAFRDNSDLTYALVRAAGKRKGDIAIAAVNHALADSSTVDAAIDALVDIGDDWARKKLRELSERAPTSALRELAADGLAELLES